MTGRGIVVDQSRYSCWPLAECKRKLHIFYFKVTFIIKTICQHIKIKDILSWGRLSSMCTLYVSLVFSFLASSIFLASVLPFLLLLLLRLLLLFASLCSFLFLPLLFSFFFLSSSAFDLRIIVPTSGPMKSQKSSEVHIRNYIKAGHIAPCHQRSKSIFFAVFQHENYECSITVLLCIRRNSYWTLTKTQHNHVRHNWTYDEC